MLYGLAAIIIGEEGLVFRPSLRSMPEVVIVFGMLSGSIKTLPGSCPGLDCYEERRTYITGGLCGPRPGSLSSVLQSRTL